MFADKLTMAFKMRLITNMIKYLVDENVIFHKHFIANIRIRVSELQGIISSGTNDFKGRTAVCRITPDTKQDLFAVLIKRSVFKEIYNTGAREYYKYKCKLLLLLASSKCWWRLCLFFDNGFGLTLHDVLSVIQ